MILSDLTPLVTSWTICIHLDQPRSLLTPQKVGAFWLRISSEYPNFRLCADRSDWSGQLDDQSGLKYMFSSKDHSSTVIVSDSGFSFRGLANYDDISSCNDIRKLAKISFDHFRGSITDNIDGDGVGVGRVELIFNGVINPCRYWENSFDTYRVFPSIRVIPLDVSIGSSPDFKFMISYCPDSDVDLHVAVQTRRKAKRSNETVLSFEYRAEKERPANIQNQFWSWYDRAYQSITRCFVAMTNPYVRSVFWRCD